MRRGRTSFAFTGLHMVPDNNNAGKPDSRYSIPQDTILKIAKEITVKFIEVGRVTPATFELTFKDIYLAIDKTVNKG